ncbi:MAG: ribosome biogenesis GTP-binding protein YihA/YsxC [Lentisphaeria bacterium]|nr:ribosome biogenesis GTP-binding protein YihA/YsxC [Lentisphaeria bacterium]
MAVQFITGLGQEDQLVKLLANDNLLGHNEPRFAFLGRSNVGKSSLLNALTRTKSAFVSKKPGHTREVNFFLWEDMKVVLADLPGYGFAKATKQARNQWSQNIDAYLRNDKGLNLAFILLDARHGPTDLDLELFSYLSKLKIPMCPIMTKNDKLKTQKLRHQRKQFVKAAFEEMGVNPEAIIWSSSEKGHGINQIKSLIRERIS